MGVLGRLHVSILISAVLGACAAAPPATPSITSSRAEPVVERAMGVPLHLDERPDSAALVNLTATLTGGDGRRQVLALVFDSALATRQVVGSGQPTLPGSVTVRERNVVVFYRGGDASHRARRLKSALAEIQ